MSQKAKSRPTASKKAITGVKPMKLRSASTRKVEVKHLAAPPTFVKPKKIHPRHLLPLIREGLERGFDSQSNEAFLRPLAMALPVTAMAPLMPAPRFCPARMFSAPATMLTFSTPEDGDGMAVATFKTKVKPTAARITGVGF